MTAGLLVAAAAAVLLTRVAPLTAQVSPVDTVSAPAALRIHPNKAFSSGEHLRFEVNYGWVTAGEAVITIADTLYRGRKCLDVAFQLNSKPFFDAFYKVRDRYRTFIDAEGIFPWRFEQHIREGGFSRDFVAEFDQEKNRAVTTGGEYPTAPFVHDIMSAFYYARTVDYAGFKKGESIQMYNFYKDSTYSLRVKYLGKQTIEVEAGTFKCIVVEPLITEGGLFKAEGRIHVWLTDDERRMPVRVRTEIPIGTVECDLIEFGGLAGPLPSKVEES